jgi:hypothetical protein
MREKLPKNNEERENNQSSLFSITKLATFYVNEFYSMREV